MRESWLRVGPNVAPEFDETGRQKLVLYTLNGRERVTLRVSAEGGFSASDLAAAAQLLRSPGSGATHPIEPQLLQTVYALQTYFAAPEVRVISGYRMPKHGGGSNHGKGRALDFVIPGVRNEELASYARSMGFKGVGTYPLSGFVHVDIRDRSYSWVDSSAPGKRNRERGVLGDVAAASDAAARARGEKPPPRYTLSALMPDPSATAPESDVPDDEEDGDDDELETAP